MNRWFSVSLAAILVFLSLYFNISFFFPFDTFLIPGFFAFIIYGRSLYLLSLVVGFISFIIFHYLIVQMSSGQVLTGEEQLRSTGLFIMSVISSLGSYFIFIKLGRRRAFYIFKNIAIIIVCGLFLERIGLIRSVSDSFRSLAYPSELVYMNDARDIFSYGFVRPKLFASEPSYVARIFGLVLASLAVLRPKTYPVKWLIFLLIVFVALLPSPSVGSGVIVALGYTAFNDADFTGVSRGTRNFAKLLLIGFGLVGVWSVALRLGLWGGAIEASAFQRLMQPAKLAMQSLAERPLFGFGIGADSSMQDILAFVQSGSDTPLDILKDHGREVFSGTVHAAVIWQLGLLGSVVLYAFLYKLFQFLSGGKPMLGLVFFVMLGFSVGDIHTPNLWGYVTIFLAVTRLRYSDQWLAQAASAGAYK